MSVMFLAVIIGILTSQAESQGLYRLELVRAAPGHLLELIDVYKQRFPVIRTAGETPPIIIRHSQGDQWDLMLIYPMGESFSGYFSHEQLARREAAAQESGMDTGEYADRLSQLTAWREDVIVSGPSLDSVADRFAEFSYYHVEMMVALPGKYHELVREREMENEYSASIGRPGNLIFTRVLGAAWEVITIGLYRDLQHFAEPSEMTQDERDAAARNAGFEAVNRIGSYLRTLMSYHHDTLAGAVR